MSRLVVPFILLAVLAAGCPKHGDEVAANAAAPAASAPSQPGPGGAQATPPAVPPAITEKKLNEGEKAVDKAVPEAERVAIVAQVTTQAPKFKLTLDAKKETLSGKGLPAQFPVSAAVMGAYSKMKSGATAQQAVHDLLSDLTKKPQAVASAPPPAAATTSATAPNTEAPGPQHISPFHPAKDPVGDWRSLGEMREGDQDFLVQHTNKYYKILMIGYTRKTVDRQDYKDGKLVEEPVLDPDTDKPARDKNTGKPIMRPSHNESPYTYDPATGKLALIKPSGPPDELLVMEKDGEPDRIYVRPVNEVVYAYTVYKKIGSGGKPATAADFKAAQEHMAGMNVKAKPGGH